jgi:hypothetical protein
VLTVLPLTVTRALDGATNGVLKNKLTVLAGRGVIKSPLTGSLVMKSLLVLVGAVTPVGWGEGRGAGLVEVPDVW